MNRSVLARCVKQRSATRRRRAARDLSRIERAPLNLTSNKIATPTWNGFPSLCKALEVNKALKVLDVSNNSLVFYHQVRKQVLPMAPSARDCRLLCSSEALYLTFCVFLFLVLISVLRTRMQGVWHFELLSLHTQGQLPQAAQSLEQSHRP